MKKVFSIWIMILMPLMINAQSLTPDWLTPVFGHGPFRNVTVQDVACENNGNVYIVGTCEDSLLIDSLLTIFPPNSNRNSFVAKLDPQGKAVWVVPIYGPGQEDFMNIAVSNSGNIYISGVFGDSIVTIGSITLVHHTDRDHFLASLDTSGQALWGVAGFGNSSEIPGGLAVDNQGNVIIVGQSTGFPATDTLGFGNVILVNPYPSSRMLYVFKFSSGGTVLWGRQIYTQNGLGYDCYMGEVGVDSTGNVYVCGTFNAPYLYFSNTGSILQNTNLIQYRSDIFICKYGPMGNVIWMRKEGSAEHDEASNIAVSPGGNFYISGGFLSLSISFVGSPLVNVDPTGYTSDIFLTKYNSSGIPQWARRCGSNTDDVPADLDIDSNGDAFLLGASQYNTTILIDTLQFTSNAVFIAHFSSSGAILEAFPTVTLGKLFSRDIAIDNNDGLVHSGNFIQTITYNGSNYYSPLPNYITGYVAKFIPISTSIELPLQTDLVSNPYPNPSTGSISIPVNSKVAKISICNSLGELIYEKSISGEKQLEILFDIPGLYFIFYQSNVPVTKKLVVVD